VSLTLDISHSEACESSQRVAVLFEEKKGKRREGKERKGKEKTCFAIFFPSWKGAHR
jgi:hypothetical protein